jgi:hypothetical protein
MFPTTSSLGRAVNELRNVLNEGNGNADKDWPRRARQILERIEQATRRHSIRLEKSGGRAVDVDTALNPSPTVARRSDELRRELDGLLQETRSLREQARTLHPAATDIPPSTVAGALPVAPEAADVADVGVFRERVEHLLEGFKHLEKDEADLIQESVTLDLGAGD